MSGGGINRPKIRAEDYGLPMRCPKAGCDYRWLKLPGIKMQKCANCNGELVSVRPRKRRR